jgi:phosphate starvation-inducible protein PhoH and related proteins
VSRRSKEDKPIHLQFEDNRLLSRLYGQHDKHLARIEQQLGVELAQRGNELAIYGPVAEAETAREAITSLYRRLKGGKEVDMSEVDAALRLAARPAAGRPQGEIELVTRRRVISPRSPTQADYMKALQEHELAFGLGPAGTGKTYLAVATAVTMLASGRVDRIILSRPAVEAGERLGFLPGDLREKVDPYLRPLYDALYDMLPADQVVKRITNGEIEIAPLAFMRGRTLSNAFIILDEAQNTTPVQMKMFLTRLGENSRMAVTGDLTQIDLPLGARSGLTDALEVLENVEGIAFIRFTDADVVRHPMVTRLVRAYDAKDRRLLDAARAGRKKGA